MPSRPVRGVQFSLRRSCRSCSLRVSRSLAHTQGDGLPSLKQQAQALIHRAGGGSVRAVHERPEMTADPHKAWKAQASRPGADNEGAPDANAACRPQVTQGHAVACSFGARRRSSTHQPSMGYRRVARVDGASLTLLQTVVRQQPTVLVDLGCWRGWQPRHLRAPGATSRQGANPGDRISPPHETRTRRSVQAPGASRR